MRLLLQRVRSGRVTVAAEKDGSEKDGAVKDGAVKGGAEMSGAETVGEIGLGMLVLVGVEKGDGPAQVEAAAKKLDGLRIFEDEAGRMNLDSRTVGGAFLLVSQFTLAGSLAKGRRPSFDQAAPPKVAEPLFDDLVHRLRDAGHPVATGRFGAHMQVELVNDGPVTFVLDL